MSELRSDPPLALRPTHTGWVAGAPTQWTRESRTLVVAVATAAASPLGGDELALDVDAGPDTTLVLRGVSASIALPGPFGERSRLSVRVRADRGATVVWLPGATIATQRCNHDVVTVAELDEDARLLTRDELLLGRHGETAGSVTQVLRATIGRCPLLHQALRVGDKAPGWDGPAVTGDHRAIGSVLIVDPEWSAPPVAGDALPQDTAIFRLADGAALVAAVANDAHSLRRRLDTAVVSLQL